MTKTEKYPSDPEAKGTAAHGRDSGLDIHRGPVMRVENPEALKAGYLADISVIDGTPLKDISCLADAKHISFVTANGAVVKNRLKPGNSIRGYFL